MKNLIEINSVKQKQGKFIGASRRHFRNELKEYRKGLYDEGEKHDCESATEQLRGVT